MDAATTDEILDSPRELRGRDLLCFSHDWNGDPLSKTHLMRLLAKRNRVLWVNSIGYRTPTVCRSDAARVLKKLSAAARPIKEVEPNLFVLNPLVVPAYGQEWVRALNRQCLSFQVRRAMQKLNFNKPINWVFNPAAAMVAGTFAEDAIVYYCVDDYTAMTGVDSHSLAALEQRLVDCADLLVVSSENLRKTKSTTTNPATLVRHGVDFAHFRKALDARTMIPAEISSLAGPVIGYFGLIAKDWVDVDLLVHVARAMPEASLVMLGKVTMDVSALEQLPNVHLLGRKPYELLPAYCRGFDVALIPFPISPVTLSANPLKAREYLSAGLPVVSTAIPEVQVLGQCRIGVDRESFVREIRSALQTPGPDVNRSETMGGESWAARLAEIEAQLLLRRPDLMQHRDAREAMCKAA